MQVNWVSARVTIFAKYPGLSAEHATRDEEGASEMKVHKEDQWMTKWMTDDKEWIQLAIDWQDSEKIKKESTVHSCMRVCVKVYSN